MTREKAIEVLKSECYVFNPLNFDRTTLINTALDVAIESLKQPYDQVKWERDIAISQLEELGYSLGEKVEEDGIKKAIKKAITDGMQLDFGVPTAMIVDALKGGIR